MWNRNKPESHHTLPAERRLFLGCYMFPWMCSVFTDDGGKEFESFSDKVTCSRASGGDWGRGDSSVFSPAPENRVSREVGGDQGNGQAQTCFGSWMKNKRVNYYVP